MRTPLIQICLIASLFSLSTKPAPKPSPLNCYSCDSSACDANHPGSIVVRINTCMSICNQISSQDCSNQTPPPVGPTYCTYVQSWIDPEAPVVQRGCADLHETPELPEPPLGGVVCVDQDWKKVVSCLYNKEILHSNVLRKRFLRFVDIIFWRSPSACAAGMGATSLRSTTLRCNQALVQHQNPQQRQNPQPNPQPNQQPNQQPNPQQSPLLKQQHHMVLRVWNATECQILEIHIPTPVMLTSILVNQRWRILIVWSGRLIDYLPLSQSFSSSALMRCPMLLALCSVLYSNLQVFQRGGAFFLNFLDALASLDFKLSLSELVSH